MIKNDQQYRIVKTQADESLLHLRTGYQIHCSLKKCKVS